MSTSLLMLAIIVVAALYQKLGKRLHELTDRLQQREQAHAELQLVVERLHQELRQLSRTTPVATTPIPAAAPKESATQQASAVSMAPAMPAAAPVAPLVVAAAAPVAPVTPPLPVSPAPAAAPVEALAPAERTVMPAIASATATETPASLPPVAAPAAVVPAVPVPVPVPRPTPAPQPVAASVASIVPPVTLPPNRVPMPARVVPAGPATPTWWDQLEKVLLDNWTGILGAVVLVTGIGFLGVYTALRVSAPVRFAMISGFAAALLGLHYYLRPKPFAAKLHVWLQSSAAAVFLFACVGAVSVPGLQWVAPPFSYALLLAGVAVNLWLAWDASRESVATLHGVLSLVALAVLPHELLTLAAGAGVTVFSIGITYRQRWKYQLLLSILSFFIFHQYWYQGLTATGALSTTGRLLGMALVLLVGSAAAVVQYRKVYASLRFDALLFAAHVLNWTCLGVNLYRYSTGSPWKTVPLALGAVLTFWIARQARQLGIGWLFRTDSIISLMLALLAAFSLQGWHASGTIILLFMMLETLLVAFVMAREQEKVVFQVAAVGALLTGLGLVLLNLIYFDSYTAAELPRNGFMLLLAGLLGAGYYYLLNTSALLADEDETRSRELHSTFGVVVGALYLTAASLLAKALFGFAHPPLVGLLGGTLLAAGAVFAGAWALRSSGGWFRTLHLLCGQVLLLVFVLGLHEAGLSWPASLTLLYLETLLLAGACGWALETHAYRTLLGAALLSGLVLLLVSTSSVRELAAPLLYQRLLLLLLTGFSSSVLLMLPVRHPAWLRLLMPTHVLELRHTLQALAVLLYLGAASLLMEAVFGRAHPPLEALLGASGAVAGLLFGLAYWWRGMPGWFRSAHLLLGQLVLTVTVLGLHEAGLAWPTAATLLHLEMLLLTLLLAWRRETLLYRVLLVGSLLLTAALPVLAYRNHTLPATQLALLLTGAALAALATQAGLHHLQAPVFDAVPLSYNPAYRLRLLGHAPGLLLLTAGGLVFEHTWAAWAVAGLGVSLLLLRLFVVVPGLWLGLLAATVGYQVLQWSHALPLPHEFQPLIMLRYLGPLLLVTVAGLFCSWWRAARQHVRWPWLYLLGMQAVVATWVAFAPRAAVLPVLLWVLLATLAAGAAHLARRRWMSAENILRAGTPDRFLLHLTYALLALALLGHFRVLLQHTAALLPGLPDQRLSAGALLVLLAGLAWLRPPTTEPMYKSWRYLQPLLPEAFLLFGAFTLSYEVRAQWLPLLWLGGAFALTLGGARLPWRLRRVQVYGLLFFGAAVAGSCYVSLAYLAPGQLLTARWLATAAAVALLFAYAAVQLRPVPTRAAYWPPLLAPLAGLGSLPPALLIPVLLYPAFAALTVLLLQSFDRSVLTVLLMLEVVAAFVSSLLLRRQDLRYVALTGMALSLGRLFFFDLRQTGTITRAVVFILMGLLLLGMNALYARFKGRFAPLPAPEETLEAPEPEPPIEPRPTLE